MRSLVKQRRAVCLLPLIFAASAAMRMTATAHATQDAGLHPRHIASGQAAAAALQNQPANLASEVAGRGKNARPADQTITQTLSGWKSAMASNNSETQAAFYAENVDKYFLRRNVTRDYVRSDKQAFLNAGRRLQSFNMSDIGIQVTSSGALVSLTKSWVLLDPTSTAAKARTTRSRLWLKATPGGWKISGEQDLKAKSPEPRRLVPSLPHRIPR